MWDSFIAKSAAQRFNTNFQFSMWDSDDVGIRLPWMDFDFQFSMWDSVKRRLRRWLDTCFFQFSMWDSLRWPWPYGRSRLTFNSLCEILLHRRLPLLHVFYLSILYVRFHIEEDRDEAPIRDFQFSMWDSGLTRTYPLHKSTFNSLCEIHLLVQEIWSWRGSSFQFSMWDSWTLLQPLLLKRGLLSILYVRFWAQCSFVSI